MTVVSKSTEQCHHRLMDTGIVTNKISSKEDEVVINGITLSTNYDISVYLYRDLPSINSTRRLLRFDGELILV